MEEGSSNFKVMCPYCAYIAPFIRCRIKRKRGGYSRKMFQCPDCLRRMNRFTMTMLTRFNTEFWAKWMYAGIRTVNYSHDRFYERISWVKLMERLKLMDIANEFWESWRIAKEMTIEELNSVFEEAYIAEGKQTKLVNIWSPLLSEV